ncbi:hypothetical protein GL263_07885 [Streptomyces durbertensis]|uniref:Uncharacterized protein n=1 Tax=Streptomyces durbertensis TaxID=2448886 RepID=A0ABR6EEU1_9ACTN|nr:hypothetical protein [Streptomyces durbertensis]MBB1243480.1 hypothetical protein [Streptomyces durbertensis]
MRTSTLVADETMAADTTVAADTTRLAPEGAPRLDAGSDAGSGTGPEAGSTSGPGPAPDDEAVAVAVAKARAAQLLLAFRHGNQLAFDAALSGLACDERTKDLVAALTWVASDSVGRAYEPAVADRVLSRLALRAPVGERWALTDEEAAPDVARLLTAVDEEDVETVRELVRATPDTTFVLGKLVQAVALLLPAVPRPYLRRVLTELAAEPNP